MTATEVADQVFRQLGTESAKRNVISLVALPNRAEPRWLLPAGETSLAQVLSSWAPYRAWSRVAWSAIRAANRIARPELLPGTASITIGAEAPAHWREVGWRETGDPIVVIYVGTPGPRRKAVVHLVERESGRCRAVVKVPLTNAAQRSILHEASVLGELENEHYRHAPTVTYVDWSRGITTQTFAAGAPAPRKLTSGVLSLLASLAHRGEVTCLRRHAERWARELGEHSAHPSAVEALATLQEEEPLPGFWEHGDFAPWNIRLAADGGLALLDWENALRLGLPLMDLFHFLHMQDFLFGGAPRAHFLRVRDFAITMRVSLRHVRKLETAYLVSSYAAGLREYQEKRSQHMIGALQRLREVVA